MRPPTRRLAPATALLALGLSGCIGSSRGVPAEPEPVVTTDRGGATHARLRTPSADTYPAAGALHAFLREAEAAAAPFRSLQNAVAAGYRRLGPSFPGMGEHWIHPGLIVEGRVAPNRPPVLCYARVDGEPRLVALAFAVPLEGDESPPAFPAGRAVWHDHAERVDEETLLLGHPASHHGGEGPRLAMFHAWIGLENPDGMLAQNNWRLAFVQAGVDTGDLRPSADAARGLSLHTAGPDYYLALFRAAARPDDREIGALRAVLQRRARAAGEWAEARRGQGRVGPRELSALETLWRELWDEVLAAVDPATAAALARLR